MSWNNKVIWTEGMFLRPQHFQQQERYFQNWIESRCGVLRSFSWGISELKIDDQLLALGKFAVISAHGIFPDGTPFKIPEDHPCPAPLEISSDAKDETVHLALPVRRYTGKELSKDEVADHLSRYRLRELEVKDLHSDPISNGGELIQSGELWIRLRLASQDQGAFVTLPIARVKERKANGQILLDDRFIPTGLYCQASDCLVNYILEIQGLLHHRGEALAKHLDSPGAGGVAGVVDFLLLQIVNRYEPLFNHLAELDQFHPEAFYSILVQMAGELATITHTHRRPQAFPPYIHENQTASFEPIVVAIREALNWEPERRAIPIPLKEHQFGIRTAVIHDRQLIKMAVFVLAVNAQVSADALYSSFPRQATLATTEKLRDLVMTHTPGIGLRPLAVAPRQIPFHAGFSYFELEKNSPLWAELEKSGAIAMHFAGEYPGLELEFWAIKG